MFVNAKLASFVVLVAAIGAQAQSSAPALPTGVDSCIIGCITDSATSAGCTGITDITCLCTSAKFQTAAATCLQSQCTASDLTAALALQSQECAAAGISVSAPASTAAPSATGAPSASGASGSSASSGSAGTSKPSGSAPAPGSSGSSGASAPAGSSAGGSSGAPSPSTTPNSAFANSVVGLGVAAVAAVAGAVLVL